MKKILVPCDFSEQAVNAFRFAFDIATQAKGEIHLINVVEVPVLHDSVLMPVMAFEEALFKELREKAEKQFKKIIDKYAAGKVKVESKVIFGPVSRMLFDYIEEKGIDLVVMGTKGASGVREVLIGSNAEKMVRNSPVPVIAIKKYVKGTSIKNIVFPNTLNTENQEDLVLKVKALQNFFKATLHIVWINTPTNFTRDTITLKRLNAFAKRFMLKDFTINVFNDPYEEAGVNNFAQEIGADMIAMGTHGRKGLAHFFSGSVAEDVVNHVECPIWTSTIKK
ncbi:MAG: universal stress protein [Cyclobacteriaceae bacterium]|nr:universal stress protein [Cyclobacteriaceae bacterium]UYN87935.1 MAG: universal stress protein [Cyclobacteriaceae bacterium]